MVVTFQGVHSVVGVHIQIHLQNDFFMDGSGVLAKMASIHAENSKHVTVYFMYSGKPV